MGQPLAAAAAIEAAMKRAPLVWLAPPGGTAVPAWLLWHDDSAYVVGGPGEQPLPGIEPGCPALVTVPGEARDRILTWRADVSVVPPRSDEWDRVVPLLVRRRLNATADAADRWAAAGRVLRLTPTGELTERDDTLPVTSLAAPPASTPATTSDRPAPSARPPVGG